MKLCRLEKIIFVTGIGLILFAKSVSPDCGNRPEIEHSFNGIPTYPPYPEGATINYLCLQEYSPHGNDLFTCKNGNWTGGPFSCIIKICQQLPSLPHGTMIGKDYEVGSVMRFSCDTGYKLFGSDTMQCKIDSNWKPQDFPECRIIKCPTSPYVEHGTTIVEHSVDGQANVYGVVLRVQCYTGYMRSGLVRVKCNADGQWTKLPKCKPVTCPEYPGLNEKCVKSTKLEIDGTLLFIYCLEHSTFVYQGKKTASCFNRTWDNLSIGCFCNCEVKPHTDLVRLENVDSNGVLKHNEILNWTCTNGSTKITSEQLICNNSLISNPDCVMPLHDTDKTWIIYITVIPALAAILCVIGGIVIKRKRNGNMLRSRDNGNYHHQAKEQNGEAQTSDRTEDIPLLEISPRHSSQSTTRPINSHARLSEVSPPSINPKEKEARMVKPDIHVNNYLLFNGFMRTKQLAICFEPTPKQRARITTECLNPMENQLKRNPSPHRLSPQAKKKIKKKKSTSENSTCIETQEQDKKEQQRASAVNYLKKKLPPAIKGSQTNQVDG